MSFHRGLPDGHAAVDCNVCGKTWPVGEAYTSDWVWIRYVTFGNGFNLPFCSWACLSIAASESAEAELFVAAQT